MHIDQDDLRLLSLLRAVWAGGADARAAEASLGACPGRAAGRVAAWSLCRALTALRTGARRPVRIGEGLAPSPDERVLLEAARRVAAGEEEAATEGLRWLVRASHAADLAARLRDVAGVVHGYAAPRRAKAATA